MIFRSHRGGVFYTPENTMPAFRAAFEAGFEQIETDPQYTKDGKIVVEITPVEYSNGYNIYIGGTMHSISRDDMTVNSNGKVEFILSLYQILCLKS